jgi:hypothetical protein
VIERALAGMTERGMAEVVGERQRLGQILVKAERARERACDLGDLERMGQTGAKVVAFGKTNTWVWCASRRNAVAWMMRSQSRRKALRVALTGSGCSRPRLLPGADA